MAQQFVTHKRDFSNVKIDSYTAPPLNTGEVRLEIEKFAYTANNITYAVVGDLLRYWEFFPPANRNAEDWGVVPVWGYAKVSESNCSEISVGERLFGYFPPATELVINPARITSAALVDGSAHRATLPPTYNSYRRVGATPSELESENMLLFPLYATGFCIHDMLAEHNWFNAEQIIITSASSKTSIGTALSLDSDATAPSVVGLTSTGNKAFVDSLALYTHVFDYAEISSIDASKPTVVVDISGNAQVIDALIDHLKDALVYCSQVGATHWDEAARTAPAKLDKERMQQFFAPARIQKRVKEWGAPVFEQRTNDFVSAAVKRSATWLNLNPVTGLEGFNEIYPAVLTGRSDPSEGIVVKL